jgi:hypothetical protein
MEFQPWVVELWSNPIDSAPVLMGVCRLSLAQLYSSIYKSSSPKSYIAFLYTNLYPIILYDSDLPISNIRGTSTVGVIRIRLAFGTP